MGIKFRHISTQNSLINPLKGFTPDEIPLEIRFDPLTGQTGRVFDLPYRPPERPDLQKVVEKSREIFCPFCPDTLANSTPLFPEELIPEGRITVGKATLIPNLLPLDTYAAVTVISDEHYIAMEDLVPERITDAFIAAHRFIKRVLNADPAMNYFYINWNYMPPAGSSMVHPHIQVNCGSVPTNQHRLQIEACRSYREANGSDFWADYMEAEKIEKERYLGESGEGTFWVMNYVPQSFIPDVWCVFKGHDSLEFISEGEIFSFVEGLSRILKYYHSQNIYSFNMGLFSVRQDDDFRINAKICPRLLPRDIGNSDQTYFQTVHKEPCSIWRPESICPIVRDFFNDGQATIDGRERP